MSLSALNWAFSQKVPTAGQKCLLVAIANFADDQGRAFPGIRRLSEMTSQNEKSVRRHLAALERSGLLRREHRRRSNGSRTTDELWLCAAPDVLSGSQPGKKAVSAALTQVKPDTASGQMSTGHRTFSPGSPDNMGGLEPPENPNCQPPETTTTTTERAVRCAASGDGGTAADSEVQPDKPQPPQQPPEEITDSPTRAALTAAFSGWDISRTFSRVPGREARWLTLSAEQVQTLHADAVRRFGKRYRGDLEIMLDNAAHLKRVASGQPTSCDQATQIDMDALMRFTSTDGTTRGKS